MLHFQYTRNCSIGHFFPLFLPPTYEWPRPTVLKNWWVFFGELQYYIICYMWPYGLANLLFMLLWWAFTGSDIIWPEFLASTPATLRRSPVKVKPGIRGAKSLARLAPAEKWLVKWPTLLYFVHRESPHIHTFTHKSHTKTPHLTTSHFTSTYPSIYKPKNINFHFQTDHGNITSPDKKNRQQKSVLRPLKYSHIVTYSSLARNSTCQFTPSLSNVIHFFF